MGPLEAAMLAMCATTAPEPHHEAVLLRVGARDPYYDFDAGLLKINIWHAFSKRHREAMRVSTFPLIPYLLAKFEAEEALDAVNVVLETAQASGAGQ